MRKRWVAGVVLVGLGLSTLMAFLFPEPLVRLFLIPVAEEATGYSVSVEGLSISWSDGVRAERVILFDRAGEFLSIRSPLIVPHWWSLTGDQPRFDAVKAEGVSLLRPPLADEEATDDPLALPDLPSLLVDELAVERVDVATAVLGRGISFSLAGGRRSGAAGEDEATFAATSLSGAPFSLRYHGARSVGEERFEIRYEEKEGGPLAGLVPSFGGKGVGFALDGKGWGSSRKGSFALTVGGIEGAEGSYTFSDGARRSVSLEARLHPGVVNDRVDVGVVELLAARIEAPRDLSSLTVSELHFGTLQGEARGHGEIDFVREKVTGSFNVVADDLSKVDPRFGGALTGAITVTGDLGAPVGRGDLHWENAILPGARFARVTVSAKGVPDRGGTTAAITLGLEESRIDGLVADRSPMTGEGILHLDRDGNARLERLVARGRNATLTLAGERSQAGDVRGDLNLAVADMGRWIDGGQGAVSLRWRPAGEIEPLRLAGPLHIEGKTFGGIDTWLGPTSRIMGTASLDARHFSFGELVATGDGVRLTGALDYRFSDGALEAPLDFAMARSSRIPVAATGAARLSLRPQGNGYAGTLRVTDATITYRERRFEQVTLALDGAGEERYAGKGSLSLARSETPATVRFDWRYDPASQKWSAKGEGLLSSSRVTFDAADTGSAARFASRNLSDIGAFLSVPLGGSFDAEGTWRDGRLVATGSGRNIRYDEMALNRFNGSANLSWEQGRPVGSFGATATYFATTDMVLTDAKVSGQLDRAGGGRIETSLQGFSGAPFTLDAGAAIRYREGDESLTLDRLAGAVGDIGLTLARPMVVRRVGNRRTLSGVLSLAQGTITVEGAHEGGKITLRLDGKRLPLALLSRFDLLAVTGDADLALDLSGSVDAPTGNFSMTAADIRPVNRHGPESSPLSIAGEGIYRANTLKASLDMKGRNSVLRFSGEVPLRLSFFPFVALLNESGRGRSVTTFDVDLADFIGLAPRMSFGVAGKVSGRIELSGPLDDPQATGTMTVRQGRFDLYDLGITLREIDASLEAREGSLTLARFSAIDRKKGSYRMEGSLLLSAVRRFPYHFAITAADVDLIGRDDLTA
ncbi:MAG: hypothetical protein HQK87_09945, partial [Nitrospinae bacterium]|nr:hypothetical protein [Nitrospinota bacterium]